MDVAETQSFTEIIDEVYSTRVNYLRLRQLAIKMIVNNLPRFRKTPEPMKSIPNFTYDLFQAALDKYVDGSSGEEKTQFHVRFDCKIQAPIQGEPTLHFQLECDQSVL